MFKNAIVRKPCPSITDGLTTANLGKPNFEKAVKQHQRYVNTLKSIGLEVTELEEDDRFPDSTFVEDVALLTPHCAIITNPGAPTRADETELIEPTLKKFFKNVERILPPGTVDAGDVMQVSDVFYIGISERTNAKGAKQLMKILERYNLRGFTIPVKEGLHLKSSLSYLGNNTLLATSDFSNHPAFEDFDIIEINETEAYAANSLLVNGKVITPKGHYHTIDQIENAGFEVVELDMSEFEKVDGSLSCLSLRF